MRYLILPDCLGERQIGSIRSLLQEDGLEVYVASETREAYRRLRRIIRDSPDQVTCVCCSSKHELVRPRLEERGIEYTFVPLDNSSCTKGRPEDSTVDIDALARAVLQAGDRASQNAR